ncbi:MAG: LTA synthase family protein, partial [Spirochaetota bacterium]
DSMDVILSSFQLNHLAAAAVIMACVYCAQRRRLLITGTKQNSPRWIKIISASALYLFVLFSPYATYDDLSALFREAASRFLPDFKTYNHIQGYPYLADSVDPSGVFPSAPREKMPNVIIVMIESYNANFFEAKTPDGREITPVLNALAKEGIYCDRFYANSIQTCKGQAAALLSVIPSIRGKIFTHYPALAFKALPSYFLDAGYDTVFMQASEDLRFDSTDSFMARAGFRDIRTAYEFIRPEDENRIWGWGPEDGLFYRRFFEHLDRRRNETGDKPVFAVLATVSNHMRFDHLPDDRKQLYKKPLSIEQNYANSLHLCDSQLKELTDQIGERPYLSDTIIIITGDHSYPMNEHGVAHNENGFYDESFRIPFLIVWKGKLPPSRIRDKAFSQIDIAPTLLDMTGMTKQRNSFAGKSIFLKDKAPRPVYLIQPYRGMYLQSIRYPYKYIINGSNEEYLFDLKKDPQERISFPEGVPAETLNALKGDIRTIHRNQRILDLNALWPENQHSR